MADLSVTAASVRRGSEYAQTTGTSGEAITVGQVVALDDTDSKLYLTDVDSATTQRRKVTGIAISAASAVDQTVTYVTSGYFNPGTTVTVGELYVGSGNAGGIAPEGDLASADTLALIGFGYSTTLIKLCIQNPEIIVA